MRVLHLFFSSVIKPQHRFLGTTKDIRGRTQYFEERGIVYEEAVIEVRKEKYVIAELKARDLSRYDVMIWEGTYYPHSLNYLRHKAPHIRVYSRGINAEIYHWLHSMHAAFRFDSLKRTWFDFKGTVNFGLRDIKSARRADGILSICDWETQRYWNRLCVYGRAHTLPYFLPDSYLQDIPKAAEKANRCVCMMTTKAGRPFLTDAARNLMKLINGLGGDHADWEFAMTGDYVAEKLLPCPRMKPQGFLDDPLPFIAGSRVVALLSDYGFGFKTKLLEAICAGCWVMVTPGLFKRLPEAVKPYALVVRKGSQEDFRRALKQAEQPLPEGDPNGILREQQYATLDRLLTHSASPRWVSEPVVHASVPPQLKVSRPEAQCAAGS